MASSSELMQATSALRDFSNRAFRRGARVHPEALIISQHSLRAIEGICGGCENLKAPLRFRDGKRTAVLQCIAGIDPVRIHRQTNLGQQASCDKFIRIYE